MGSRQQLTANISPSSPATISMLTHQPTTKKLPRPPELVITRPVDKRHRPASTLAWRPLEALTADHKDALDRGFKKLNDHVAFHEYLVLTPFLVPRKEDCELKEG